MVEVEYEKLPLFCSSCKVIGHSLSHCNKNKQHDPAVNDNKGNINNKKVVAKFVPKKAILRKPDLKVPKILISGADLNVLNDSNMNQFKDGDALKQLAKPCQGKEIMIQDCPA